MLTTVSDYAFEAFLLWRIGSTHENPSEIEYLTYGNTEIPEHKYYNISSSIFRYNELPAKNENQIRICCISDTHDRHASIGNIPECDIFIHTGDIFMTSRKISKQSAISKLISFNNWLETLPAKHKIIIAGNHDKHIKKLGYEEVSQLLSNAIYLCNTSIELFGLKIFGSPVSRGTSGNHAFQSPNFIDKTILASQENANTIDILLTHSNQSEISEIIQPKIAHIWGHAHGSRGIRWSGKTSKWLSICCCIMDRRYIPTFRPFVFDIIQANSETKEINYEK